MATNDLREFKADHEGGENLKGSEVMEPVTGAGGAIKKRRADQMKNVDPNADKVDVVAPGNKIVREDADLFEALFEGMDLNEEFKNKIALVFESAVNEAVANKTVEIAEAIEEEFQAKLDEVSSEFEEDLEESLSSAMDEIVENLDNYLDYVVAEWMKENEIAIEAGVKVEMAESLMENLKSLFYEHNISVDEETIDVVADLEEELASLEEKANEVINDNLKLVEEVKALRAEQVFNEMTEGLTSNQIERFRLLSEKLNYEDLDAFEEDLGTIKESFFKSKAPLIREEVEEEEMLTEDTTPKVRSSFDTVNALADAIGKFKAK